MGVETVFTRMGFSGMGGLLDLVCSGRGLVGSMRGEGSKRDMAKACLLSSMAFFGRFEQFKNQ